MGSDWESNSQLVLQTLKEIKEDQSSMRESITKLQIQVGMLNVKSGIFGFVGSALALLIAVLISYLK